MKYAQIIIDLKARSIDKPFTYKIPEQIRDNLAVGSIVSVPFGAKIRNGFCIGFSDEEVQGIKEIKKILEQDYYVTPEFIKLASWMCQYYNCMWSDALSAVVPAVVMNYFKKKKPAAENEGQQGSRVKGQGSVNAGITLTSEQEEALVILKKLLLGGKPETFLLHGVTASGKTEIYMRLIEECLSAGREAIVLVPEISLTPQNIKLFRERFGELVAVIHSALTGTERLRHFLNAASSRAKIVLGARSAVFAPFKNLGLIIIDEEHETSYKQENAPRYNAKEIAVKRSQFNNSLLVLGSATPSVESFYKAKKGEYKYYHLPVRVCGRSMPEVEIVDLKDKTQSAYNKILSAHLKNEISYSLNNNEQIIIFLNRRGFNSFVLCLECGYIYKCKNCNISLTYHKNTKSMMCHHCFYTLAAPSKCVKCGGVKFKFGGVGTQKIEEELRQLYPGAKILRMDKDTTKKRGSHEEILTQFLNRKADILLGTQMITKGLDFPSVSLVGVALADIGLNIPDFRSSERTFQLLTQVAGRSGRGETKGKVLIQTYAPDDFSVKSAVTQDYFKFYDEEIIAREEANYPPFCGLINCMVTGAVEQDVKQLIEKFSINLKQEAEGQGSGFLFEILGPAPCAIEKIKTRFRWHTLIKCGDAIYANKIINKAVGRCKLNKNLRFIVDVDPMSLL